MNIQLSDAELQGLKLSQEELRRDLAIGLFVDRRMTLGQAAQLANISHDDFLAVLAEKNVPIHYDVDDWEADLRTLRELGKL
jgi:predicted HTH domain antitoxin